MGKKILQFFTQKFCLTINMCDKYQIFRVASSIPAPPHTFVEIDHEIILTVILLPSAESFMKGCCQLQAKVCARLLVKCLFKLAQEKSVVRLTDCPAMTIAVIGT